MSATHKVIKQPPHGSDHLAETWKSVASHRVASTKRRRINSHLSISRATYNHRAHVTPSSKSALVNKEITIDPIARSLPTQQNSQQTKRNQNFHADFFTLICLIWFWRILQSHALFETSATYNQRRFRDIDWNLRNGASTPAFHNRNQPHQHDRKDYRKKLLESRHMEPFKMSSNPSSSGSCENQDCSKSGILSHG